MKKLIAVMLSILLLSFLNIPFTHADVMDPLNDIEVTEAPDSVIVREETPVTTSVEDEDTLTELEEKKEASRKHKAKNLLDSIMWASGVVLVLVPLVILSLMVLAWVCPAVFDRQFSFITRHSVYETKKPKFFIKCLIAGAIGVLLLTGFVETLIYYTFAKIMYIIGG